MEGHKPGMSVSINLSPELEARVTTLAAARGLPVADYLRLLVEGQVTEAHVFVSSPAERAAVWRESVQDLPHTPPLSDEAISRENIYDARDR
jgi:hypothetical protein